MVLFLLSLCISGPAWATDLGTWAETRENPDPVPTEAAGYRFTGDFFGQLATLAEARPGVVEVERIGITVRGEPIWAFHVQRPGPTPPHKVLVFAGIHALEWISTEVALALLTELIEAPPPGVRVTVIPLLNPDGRDKVQADLLAGRNLYRRGNGRNIDLNRDFAVNTEARAIWKAVIPGYYSHSDTPLSQPESKALDALLDRERYDRAASLHSFGGYLYFPWSGRFERPERWAEHVAIGRAMERAQGPGAYRTRQLARWGFFFRAQGTELDHIYGRYGTDAFLIELTRSGFDPLHPRHSLNTYFRWYNPARVDRHRDRGLRAVHSLVRDGW